MIVSGNLVVPVYVKFIASLGPKFSYAADINEIDNVDIQICMNRIGDMINDYEAWKIFINYEVNVGTGMKVPKAQRFIKLQFYRTRKFLSSNRNIIITSADKGGKVVIAERETYDQKMRTFIDDCVKQNIFFRVDLQFADRRLYVESKFKVLVD